MGSLVKSLARVGTAGIVVLAAGTMMIVGVTVAQTFDGPALADTSGFELFCTNSPIGNLVFNNVVLTGTLSPASPTPGQQFSLENFQEQVPVPAQILGEATILASTINGASTATVSATGASPSAVPTGSLTFSATPPSPVPASGGTLEVPTTPTTIGPFTATSTNVSLALGSSITFAFTNIATIDCSAYPNDTLPTGTTGQVPPGLPIDPVIAYAGTPPPAPVETVTGPYELYCPHTPVGDLVFNDVTTSASITPGTLSAGEQFQLSNYQTDIPVPPGELGAAVGLGNSGFDGLAAGDVDGYGATPAQVPTGSMGFDIPIPSPVPSTPLALELPTSPSVLGPFTATGGPIVIAQDESLVVVAELSYKAFRMSCSAYPDDSLPTSGPTAVPPPGTPIDPIIAIANATGTPLTTTTTNPGGPSPTQAPGEPYELYCPGTPVGDIAVNDVVTTGSVSPSSLNEGDEFDVADLQTQFTLPQAAVQQAENLGLTTLSGDLFVVLGVSGTEGGGGIGVVSVGTSGSSGEASGSSPPTTTLMTTPTTTVSPSPEPPPVIEPFPGPFPGFEDLSFDVTLPSPVPASGVQFSATPAADSQPPTFVASGGPIDVYVESVNLNINAFGDQFGFFCNTLADDSVPTGLSAQQPSTYVTPVVATATATTNPPTPAPFGEEGPYELFCPNTPVGDIVFNDVQTTGTITPADPAPGTTFNVTGYETTLTIPSAIADAAAALGPSELTGTVSGYLDTSGATPAQLSTGTMSFEVPFPSPIPAGGLSLTVPATATTIGPFTASDTSITVAQDASLQLVVDIGGIGLTLYCEAYPNDSLPSGLDTSAPAGSPVSPVIATTSGGTSTSPSPTTSTPPGSASTPPGSASTPPGSPQSSPTGTSTGSSTGTPSGSGASGSGEAAQTAGSGSGSGVSAASGNSTTPATSTVSGSSGSSTGDTTSEGAESSASPTASESSAAPVDAPAVVASSTSLAFTGSGAWTGWVVVVGGILVLAGLAMLGLSDTPRRLRVALTMGASSAAPAQRVQPERAPPMTLRESLWIDDPR